MIADSAFWARVDQSGDCWLWTGYRDPNGYGHVRRNGTKHYTHRYALMLTGVTPGIVVDHMCHNPSCVRPAHLRSATIKQNVENRKGANRNSQSGIRGVSWDRFNKKWRGSVKHNRQAHTKSFASREDAAAWVTRKRSELFTHSDADRVVA